MERFELRCGIVRIGECLARENEFCSEARLQHADASTVRTGARQPALFGDGQRRRCAKSLQSMLQITKQLTLIIALSSDTMQGLEICCMCL